MHARERRKSNLHDLDFMTILQSNLMTGNSISKETGI